jgi:FkbM family methyltransferase
MAAAPSEIAAEAPTAGPPATLRAPHSQIGQDERVARHFGGKRGGTFVEVGASDGVRLSNSYALEAELGWRGVCVEPIPAVYAKLVRGRPLAFCSDRPLLDRSGVEVEFCVPPATTLAGIAEYLDKRPHIRDAETKLRLTTETLTEVLDRARMPATIDYLSLDTEGSELAILQGLDWSRYRFRMIHVEHNRLEPRRSEIKAFLEARGYRRTAQIRFDDEYCLPHA